MEQEFLNKFYKTQHTVRMIELIQILNSERTNLFLTTSTTSVHSASSVRIVYLVEMCAQGIKC